MAGQSGDAGPIHQLKHVTVSQLSIERRLVNNLDRVEADRLGPGEEWRVETTGTKSLG